jgi:HPt (histidine-containing phosphotransfer) domain-containing protein
VEIERISHSLKGVVANFGAAPARDAAAHLEEAARGRRLRDADPLVGRLDTEIRRLVVFFSDPDWRARVGG